MNNPAKRAVSTAIVLLAVSFTFPAAAEQNGGVGLGIDSSVDFWSGTSGLGALSGTPHVVTGFRVPIDLSRNWQIEPNIHAGYQFRRTEHTAAVPAGADTLPPDSDSDVPQTTTDTTRSLLIGGAADLKHLLHVAPDTRLHLGVTTGFDYDRHRSQRRSGTGNESPSPTHYRGYALFMGPVFGAEYFFSPGFSLGFHGKLAATWTWDDPSERLPRFDTTTFGISQFGSVALRFYF